MRKLTQSEFVKQALERAVRPVDLSQFEYKGNAIKGTALCPEHGSFQIAPNALMNRIGCPTCALKSRSDKRRMTLATFIEKAREMHRGRYDYTTTVYVGSQKKVVIVCPRHGEFEQIANAHLTGQGCPQCANERVGLNARLEQSDFLARCKAVHGDTYDLSRVAYVGMTKKIEVICQKHGSFFPQAGNFVGAGSGCPACGRESTGLVSRKPLAYYVAKGQEVHAGRFEYAGLQYVDGAAYLQVVCPAHGEFLQLAQDHIKGIGCEKCARPVFNLDTFTASATEAHGGKFNYEKADYTGTTDKVCIICPEHGEYWQTPNMHVNMQQGCPRCGHVGPSVAQLEIAAFLQQHTSVLIGHRVSRKELDVFMPDLNLAVEYHGLIWHSTKFQKDATRDFKKHRFFAEMGIRVIHIYQDEWASKKEQVQRLLLAALGVQGDRAFARNLRLGPMPEAQASAFYDSNHIQGSVGAPCTSLALFEGDTPVAVMSFSRITSIRGTTSGTGGYELRRYATAKAVVGGASRLLAEFLRTTPGVTRVVSFSDNRMFGGGMYEKMGFRREFVSAPSYWYVTTNSRMGRMPKARFKRRNLLSMPGFVFDPTLSERANCEANGFYQVHDCGKTRWVLLV